MASKLAPCCTVIAIDRDATGTGGAGDIKARCPHSEGQPVRAQRHGGAKEVIIGRSREITTHLGPGARGAGEHPDSPGFRDLALWLAEGHNVALGTECN